MITCPKCQSIATTGASDCQRCGYIFSAIESDPGFTPQKLFKWWLQFYSFWRLWVLGTATYSLFGDIDPSTIVYLVLIVTLAGLSLAGILLLWNHKKLGLYAFLVGETLTLALLLLVQNYVSMPHYALAVFVMLFVGKRAGYKRA